MTTQRRVSLIVGLLTAFVLTIALVTSCNLGSAPEEAVDLTGVATDLASAPTRTLLPGNVATTVTPIPFPTRIAGQILPTSAVILPPVAFFPTSTAAPFSIFILSPTLGNIVAGNIQVLGSASHPQFLQYRLEYGPDPNPGNLWFPITGAVQAPALATTLGIWNTTTAATPDGLYQLRLRVFLRDGRQEQTVVNNIRVQNQAPTPVPTNTPTTPRPIAAFSQDVTGGNAPLVVRFTNQSQGQISSYVWFFGDGTTSTELSPAHTYARAGIFTITLQVTGPGGTSNVSRQLSVTGINPPTASFTSDKVTGTSPLSVVFSNRSTGNISSYLWDFGDGTTSTQTAPTHVFNTVGTYNVILEVRGAGGTSRAVRQITVSNPQIAAPVAAFTTNPTTGNLPLIVAFTNTTSGTVTQYLWDFNGDGITDSTDIAPSHTYTVAGTYTVNLTAIGAGGQSSATASITALTPPQAPVAGFTAAPETGNEPLTVTFTNTTTGTATAYAWDFNNDGTVDSTETNASFTYATAGTYTARLTATGAGGATIADRTISVTVPVAVPVADFSVAPTSGDDPLAVTFTNASQGTDLVYAWDFDGNGTTDSTESDPSFTYTTAGTFSSTLTASNSAGQDTASVSITVNDPVVVAAPVAAFSAIPTSGTAPLSVTFTNLSTGDANTYSWDFNGDGTSDSTDVSPTFAYVDTGTFIVTLTATNVSGSNSASETITVTQAVPAPIAAFIASPTSGDAPLTVTFTNETTTAIDSLSWDFETDGVADNTTDLTTTHTYSTAGTYTATLTVTNASGSNSISVQIVVSEPIVIPAPVAAFTANPDSGTAPLTVTFTNTTVEPLTSFAWDFNGDGITDDSTNLSAIYTYSASGTYTATLTVTNETGTDSETRTITVTEQVAAPVAAFTAAPQSGTAPLVVTFTNTTAQPLDSISWDFNGDGTPDNTTDNVVTYTYPVSGTYVASLFVSNASGNSNTTVNVVVAAAVVAPVASFDAQPVSGNAPLTVTFAILTDDFDSFAWDFDGDGTADNTTNNPATFTYNAAGNYTASLTVTNAGGSGTISQVIAVSEALIAPIVSFTTDPVSGSTPLTVTFTNTSSGTVDAVLWDFEGDGIVDNTDTATNVTHTYDNPGTYTPTLTLSNGAGTASANATVVVSAPLAVPNATFSLSAASGDAPLTVTFTNNTVEPVDSFIWDVFGDGSVQNTTENPVTVTYDTPGTYNVTLTVVNATGSDTDTQTVTVNAPAQTEVDRTVVFSTNRDGNYEIYTMGDDGAGVMNMTNTSANDIHPAWSPNGSKIAFVSDRDGNNEIYILNVSDQSVTRLTDDGAADTLPTWSPDGARLAFVSDRATSENNIWVMNADGSNPVQLTFEASIQSDPTWSGGTIFFTSNESGNFDIYSMSEDGSGKTQLTFDASEEMQPDAANGRIVYMSTGQGDRDIYVMNTDGSGATQLTTSSGDDQYPRWTSDGRITFYSNRDTGNNDVYIMGGDGSNQVNITNNGDDDVSPERR